MKKILYIICISTIFFSKIYSQYDFDLIHIYQICNGEKDFFNHELMIKNNYYNIKVKLFSFKDTIIIRPPVEYERKIDSLGNIIFEQDISYFIGSRKNIIKINYYSDYIEEVNIKETTYSDTTRTFYFLTKNQIDSSYYFFNSDSDTEKYYYKFEDGLLIEKSWETEYNGIKKIKKEVYHYDKNGKIFSIDLYYDDVYTSSIQYPDNPHLSNVLDCNYDVIKKTSDPLYIFVYDETTGLLIYIQKYNYAKYYDSKNYMEYDIYFIEYY